MPISIDDFDQFDPSDRPVTNAEQVLRFLLHNRDQAFKAIEIADGTDVSENSIHPVLTRLEDSDLVQHKEPYWAIGDLDHVRDTFVFQSSAVFLDEELGPESREEWLEAAEIREPAEGDE